jgi:hypothetical protein
MSSRVGDVRMAGRPPVAVEGTIMTKPERECDGRVGASPGGVLRRVATRRPIRRR